MTLGSRLPDVLNEFSRTVNVFPSDIVYHVVIGWNDINWAWLLISVWKIDPKLKETTVNYFDLRYHYSIKGYTREDSNSVIQYARNVWASLFSSLDVVWYDCPLHRFFISFFALIKTAVNYKLKLVSHSVRKIQIRLKLPPLISRLPSSSLSLWCWPILSLLSGALFISSRHSSLVICLLT